MRIPPYRSPWLAGMLSAALVLPQGLVLNGQAKPASPTPSSTQPKPTTPTTSGTQPKPATPPSTAKPATPATTSTAKPAAQSAAAATPPPGTNADTGWPRTITLNSGTAVWYQPQVEKWDNQKQILAWSAVSYLPNGAKEPALGTIRIEGPTKVSLDDHLVSLDLKITEYSFTSLSPEQVKSLVTDVQALPANSRVLDLNRLTAYVATSPLQVKNVEGIKADPPKIFWSQAPAALMNLDGAEVIWSPVKELDLRYAVNTNWDLFEYSPTKTLYLRYNQSWLEATAVTGPWKAVSKLPPSFSKLPADENWKDVKAAVPGKKLSTKQTPKMFVTFEPAELIVLDSKISYLKVQGATTLLWVNNTEADLFRMGAQGDFYFLVAGRWFKSATLDGPWTFATPNLPDDFKKIPIEHPRSRVLASIPGTREATEAVLLASIPRTARINKKEVKAPEVIYQGEPAFKPIEGSKGVEQAINTDKDIVKSGDLYYMCFQGVWFMARSATGPWEVASTVPSEVYTIPASSPVHHVTYVTVEDDDDEWVTVAYVAAYTGVMIGWGCAVWGTGWYYPPYMYGGWYYPYPHTYGMAAWYNPYTGGFGRGAAVYGPYGGIGAAASYNPRTGTYARGAAAYGPYGSRAAGQAYNPRTGTYGQTRQGSNVYGNWGSSYVQRGDSWAQTAHTENYRRGTETAGIRTGSGAGAVTRENAAGNRTTIGRTQGGDIYAGRDGNVYRKTDGGGWEQNNGSGGWNPVDGVATPRDGARQGTANRPATSSTTSNPRTQQLEGDRGARTQGNQRAADRSGWQSSGGGSRSSAGSYRGGGGARAGGGGRRR